MKYLIGIDLGTSATKSVLFTADGRKIASASREYPMNQPRNGWAEQNPEDWWNAVVDMLLQITKGIDKDSIISLGISGQMHGLVMLDENHKILRPCILWCDQRTDSECEELTQYVGKEKLIEITANPALTGFTASKILWVKKNEPEIFSKCRHILLPKDYIRYRLTGDFASEMSDASGTQLLDIQNRKWSDVMIHAVGIKPEYLPTLYESCEVTGHISETAGLLCGLSSKTLVVGGAGDNAAAAIGTGTVKEGMAFTTIGTSGVVYAHTDKPCIDKEGRVHTFCCAVPNAWHIMGVTQSAGLSLEWLKNQFCTEDIAIAEKNGENIYSYLDNAAAKLPIGADRLLYLPYLMGERTPHLDSKCRGVFFGISAMHTRMHFVRAVMEGVSYSLCDCLGIIRDMGIHPETMLVTGGGGKSAFWRQMLCDVFELPVQVVDSSEGPALGVAVLAAVGAGIYKDIPSACENMIKISLQKHICDAQKTKQYMKYYKIYRSLYRSLKDDFHYLAQL